MTMRDNFLASILIAGLLLLSVGCGEGSGFPGDEDSDGVKSLLHIAYEPAPYEYTLPPGFPPLPVPSDNPLTEDGVQLGRFLFYDPILSGDSTMACASCHLPQAAFSDNSDFPIGIDGLPARRSSMSLVNVAYYDRGLFWDGRVATLEEQAVLPVEDPVELHNTWPNVERKLQNHPLYPDMFRKAFGISSTREITRDLAVRALAQFERIMLSSGTSKYDRFLRGAYIPTDDEIAGHDMFFDSDEFLPDAECGHCHTGFLMTTNEYRNNGLDSVGPTTQDLLNFEDPGRGAVTGRLLDNGLFRIPTLRNIELTAPYMHDGRFNSLEEVVEHYNSGGHTAINEDPLLYPLGLNDEQKAQIVAFLRMLTDDQLTSNADLTNPFE